MPLSTSQYGFIIDPMVPFTDASGTTIRNGYVRVFVAGSSTPVITYKNYDGATNEETIQLDNSGRTAYPVIVSKGNTYKVCVYDAEHSQESPILTIDKVVPAGANVEATNIVTGLDNVESPEAGWVKSTVSGTDAEVSLDATNVTSEVDTMVKATAASADYMMPLVHKTGSDTDKKITLGNIFKFVLNFIHSLTDTATEADLVAGNYLAIDGSAGTKKLNSTTLLTKTAQNALAGNVAPAFDATRDSTNTYKAGESVIYTDGKIYTFKEEHYGAWNASHVVSFPVASYLLDVLSNGIIPFHQRLNGELGNNWSLFNSATTQNIDDYVSVTTANTGYSGIRNSSFLTYLGINNIKQGDKFRVKFYARLHTGSNATIKMFMGDTTSPQNRDVVLTSSWTLYDFELTYSSGTGDLRWIQFSTSTAQVLTFDIKGLLVYANSSLLGGIDSVGKSSALNFAGEFVVTKNYFKYQVVTKNGSLYEFKANHSAGAWDASEVRAFSLEKYFEGVISRGLRLDGNLDSSWIAFNNATISAVNDYVKVVTASQTYSSLRNNSWPTWYSNYGAKVGDKFLLSFWARNEASEEKTIGLYVGDSTAPQNKTFVIDGEWRLYTFEFEYVVNAVTFSRLQFGNKNTATSVTFNIKDLELYPLDSLFAKEKLLEKQLQDAISHPLKGKKIAVIGDSISTIYNGNTPYWTVKDVDVGNEIEVYVSWFDIYTSANDTTQVTNKTIGGVTLTAAMIGTKQAFTPVEADVGKTIGDAYNYNSGSVKTWTEVLAEKTGATLIANASFSGASMCGGQAAYLTNTEAFSAYTVGRCRVRDDAGNFVNPDVIFIYRGTNDMTHGHGGEGYAVLDDYSLMDNGYPTSDVNGSGKYSFRRAYYMTIKALRDAYPKAMIYCCTLNVFKRIIYDRYPTRNGLYSLPMMNKVIREIAAEMGCGLVDFERDGITFENCYSEGYITDSATTPTHPNGKGHGVMGERAIVDAVFVN